MPNKSTAPTPAGFDRGVVSILFYNSTKYCEECIAALERHLPEGVAIIATDNGSTRDLAAELRPRHPGVHFIRVEKNRGAPAGLNAGCRYAFDHGARLVYIINDDAVATPGFWEACEREMKARGPGVIASIPLNFDPPHLVQYAGITLDPRNFDFHLEAEGRPHDESLAGFHPSEVFGGTGAMIARETWEAVGPFNENFSYLFEDIDYGLRARKANHVVGTAGDSTILHHGSQTMVLGSPRFFYMLLRNHLWLSRLHMRPAGYLLHGWTFVARKAVFFLRTRDEVKRSPKHIAAILRGMFDGLFGNPSRGWTPPAYR